jgi:hypothetical protein
MFWRSTLPPSLGMKSKPSNQQGVMLAFFLLIAFMAFSLTLKMDAICSSETSVNFCQIVQCYMPEVSPVHSYTFNFDIVLFSISINDALINCNGLKTLLWSYR